jgi:hypothetical protein
MSEAPGTDDGDGGKADAARRLQPPHLLEVIEGGESTAPGSGNVSAGDGSLESTLSPSGDVPSPLGLTVQSNQSGGSDDFSFGTTKPARLPPPSCLPRVEPLPADGAAAPVANGFGQAAGGAGGGGEGGQLETTPRLGKATPRGFDGGCVSGEDGEEHDTDFTFGTTEPIQLPDMSKVPRPQETDASPGGALRHAAKDVDELFVAPGTPNYLAGAARPPQDGRMPHEQPYGSPAVVSSYVVQMQQQQQQQQGQMHMLHAQQQQQMQFQMQQQLQRLQPVMEDQMHWQQQQQQQQMLQQQMQQQQIQQQHLQQQHMQQQHVQQQHLQQHHMQQQMQQQQMQLHMQQQQQQQQMQMQEMQMQEMQVQEMSAMNPYAPDETHDPAADYSGQAEYQTYLGHAEEGMEVAQGDEEYDPELAAEAQDAYEEAYMDATEVPSKAAGVVIAFTCDAQAFRRAGAASCICLMFASLAGIAVFFFQDLGSTGGG